MNIAEIKEILDSIAATSGRNDKESILKQHKDNQELKDVIQFLYNPYIVTGISKKKLNKKLFGLVDFEVLKDTYDLMDYLKKNNTGTDKDICTVQQFIMTQPSMVQDFIGQLVTKSYKCGATTKTFNKMFGKGFIPEFNVMLAKKFEGKIDGNEFIVSQKLDGCRCVLIKENGELKIFSRQGQSMEGLVEIEEEAKLLLDNMVYDGELLAQNPDGLSSKELYSVTMKKSRKDGVKTGLEFHCFDMLPVDEFKDGKSKLGCSERKKCVSVTIGNNFEYIKEVPTLYQGNDMSMINKLLDEAIANQEEGVMVNTSNGKYECKRSKEILKVKQFNEADVRVVDVIEGGGKNTGKLGAITIEFEHEGNIHTCNLGSGFSDDERIVYFNDPELIVNKIVTIGYFEISRNQQGGYGLRFPTWKSVIRDDKDEISMY